MSEPEHSAVDRNRRRRVDPPSKHNISADADVQPIKRTANRYAPALHGLTDTRDRHPVQARRRGLSPN